ncbi:MAG TPA: type II secretion system F family protein [Pusillimonas sp.]|nr:type II secretion system F family protein [Pusillimonas sp.]HCN71524.1 type II secretion system F family protein [Pusillimonas sp.]|tara:strand:- start:215863 stop:216765 length:903 start_codon:yes stop_codon:yes gene_type:complete
MTFWLSCLFAGVSLALSTWWLFRPWSQSVQGKPGPDAYSQATGSGAERMLRWVEPWVAALEPLGQQLLGWRGRRTLALRLQRAGLSGSWTPSRFVAYRLLGLGLGAMTGLVVARLLGLSGALETLVAALLAAGAGACVPGYLLKRLTAQRQRHMLVRFPFLLDMVTLCVEAGLNLQGALQQASQHGPSGPLMDLLRIALAELRTGTPRNEALRALAHRSGLREIGQWVQTLEQAEQMGMNLAPVLRAQSDQRRAERFLRAEKLALQAPVKMLFPMVVCIFPCTFLMIGFPIAVKLFAGVV